MGVWEGREGGSKRGKRGVKTGKQVGSKGRDLPDWFTTITINPDVTGYRADTAYAGRSAIAFDALQRRAILRGEIPK